jgi:hypothetical protein
MMTQAQIDASIVALQPAPAGCHPQPYFQPVPLPPIAAGHCGKCGAPYTVDMLAGAIGPPRFITSCKCWNVS